MKKILIRIGNGLGFGGLVLGGMGIIISPVIFATETSNPKWLLLFIPHIIAAAYLLGKDLEENKP